MSKKIASPNFEPRLVTSNKTAARQRINADAGSGGVNFTIPQPWLPERGDESRVFYPIDRLQANRHNQLYYKVDGTIGTVIDMYAEIIGSQFHLSGEGVEGEVKDAFELSLEKTMAIAAFPMFIKYYLVFGECIPHLTFDKDKKIWTKLMFHNPDQISVTKCDLLNIPDILEFTPDETLRKLARSPHPVIQTAMSTLPPEVLAALISGQGIPLDTNTNVTFLARKQFDHETRGTSILSRLYRILMIEDAIAQVTIQTARRHAAPLKLAKVGMMLPDGNPWMPEVGFEDTLVQLLAAAETDPHSFLILPWHVQFEAFGTMDRALSLRNEYETIEKIKLTALGVSSEFMHGQCFVADTRVLTSDFNYKPIQNIEIGEQVIDKTGNTQTIQNAWESHIPKTLTEIKLMGGTTLLCTHTHKFPVWAWQRKCACGCGSSILPGRSYVARHYGKENELKFKSIEGIAATGYPKFKGILENHNPYQKLEASNIHKRDYLMMPRKFEEIPLSIDITNDYAKLLGFYVSEGNAIYRKDILSGINFTFHQKEKSTFAQEIVDAGKNLNMHFVINDHLKTKTCVITSGSIKYSNFYTWLVTHGGRYSHFKKLSPMIMKASLSFKEEFIKAVFKGDGHRGSYKRHNKKRGTTHTQFSVHYVTTSKVLAEQLRTILIQLGIFTAIIPVKAQKDKIYPTGKIYDCKDSYHVCAYSIHAQKLTKLVWNEDIILAPNSRSHVWIDDDFIYVPITSAKTIMNEQKLPVYNLTVSNDHSYIVEGFGTYNSTYNSMKGQLQVLMMRMSNLRNYFEQMWWIPKFFRPMSELNEFIKPTDAEVNHRVKFRRSKKELLEDNRYIIPTMNWVRQLDPKVDDALLDTYEQIVVRLGEKVSRATILSAANLDTEVEDNNLREEAQSKLPKEKKPSGGGGEIPAEIPEGEAPVEETTEETIELEVPGASKQSKKIPAYQEDLETFIDFIQTKKPTKFWARVLNKDEKPEEFIKKLGNGNIERVVDFLEGTGYNYKEIEGFKKDLVDEVEIPTEVKEDVILSMVDKLNATGTGQDIDKAIDTFITTVGKDLGLESLIGKGRLRELDLVKG